MSRERLIAEATFVFEDGPRNLLTIAEEADYLEYKDWASYALYPDEFEEVMFMFAYLLLLEEGEEE